MQQVEDVISDTRAIRSIDTTPLLASPFVGATVVFGLAAFVRIGQLDAVPHFDELYHMLAARSWLETGEFRIADGIYHRASLYTWLIAQAFAIFGESLEVARLISVVFGSLLIAAMYLWVDRVAGRLAAVVTAFLGVFWSEGILTSQFTRFYALHGLLFFLGAIGAYRLATAPISRTAGLLTAIATVFCFGLALYLQPITLIGLVGLLTWFGLFVALPLFWSRPERWWILSGLTALALIAVGASLYLGTIDDLWERFRWAPEWVAFRKDAELYYHRMMISQYPTLWPLLPLATLISIAFRPRPSLFCASIVAVCFFIHSLAAMKTNHYIYYVTPFFFVLFGISAASIMTPVVQVARGAAQRALANTIPWVASPTTAWIAVIAAVLFLLFSNRSFEQAILLAVGSGSARVNASEWQGARPALEPWLNDDRSVIVTTDELRALYFLGRYDVLVNSSRLSELPGADEFDLDPRTGHPVVASAGSVERIFNCSPKGLFVTARSDWREEGNVVRGVMADIGMSRFTKVELPANPELVAFSWNATNPDDPQCAGFSTVVSKH